MMATAVREEVLREELGDRDLKVRRAKDIAETAYANATVVEQLIMAQLKVAQEDPSQALKAASAIKGLSLAAAGLERLHDLKKRALGLDKMEMHDDLPDLRIHCLTDEEEDAIRRGQKTDGCDWDDTPDDGLAGVPDDGSLDEELDANEIIEEGVE
ncbi:hypothetical protein [Segnochrobactrum spirostomi]|uniref:Uncharacterized protein n=1 Tax=Segnochrobactrum spirostomi TaxID=2608987 RepID=A0A6A7XZW8_9HYPH|nr:hypothetical protein [Segnochrobactrum spirostomi]MQT12025.1 hypothetical protein [Segnochrobactrum spirostomi]